MSWSITGSAFLRDLFLDRGKLSDIITAIFKEEHFMSLPKSPLRYSPFSNLNKKIEPRATGRPFRSPVSNAETEQEDAGAIFLEAMSDVERLSEVRHIKGKFCTFCSRSRRPRLGPGP